MLFFLNVIYRDVLEFFRERSKFFAQLSAPMAVPRAHQHYVVVLIATMQSVVTALWARMTLDPFWGGHSP